MKKLLTYIKISLALALSLSASSVFAEGQIITSNTDTGDYLENLSVYEESGEFLGIFKGSSFLDDHVDDIVYVDNTRILMFGSQDAVADDGDIVIKSFTLGQIDEFSVPFESNEHNFSESQVLDQYIYFSFPTEDGDIMNTRPLGVTGRNGISVVSGPRNSEPLLVNVVWDPTLTEVLNTEDDNTGKWYYRFGTGTSFDNFAVRNKIQDVFLTASSTSGTQTFTLCSYGDELNERFIVSYPSCATQSDFDSHLFRPGSSYEVYFTDAAGNVINGPQGDGRFVLPPIPGTTAAPGLLSFQTNRLEHPAGGEYFAVDITVSEDGPEDDVLDMFIRTEVSGQVVITPFGDIPYLRGTYRLPPQTPELPLRDGFYQLVVEYNDQEFQIEDLGRIGGPSDTDDTNNDTGGSGDGLFTVPESIQGGLAPGDCGYDIRTLANPNGKGRMCGLVDIIGLIQRVIEYIFFLVLPIAAIVFAYAGFMLMTSGSSDSRRSAAKRAMTSLVVGIIIIMGAWFVVAAVLSALGVDTTIAEQFLDIDL